MSNSLLNLLHKERQVEVFNLFFLYIYNTEYLCYWNCVILGENTKIDEIKVSCVLQA